MSFNRAWNRGPDGTLAAGLATLSASDLGLSMPAIPTTTHTYAPEIGIERYSTLMGNTGDPSIFETYSLTPSLTHVVKHHTLHYGAEFMLFHDIAGGVGQPNGNFGFGTGYTWQNPKNGNNTGGSIADLALGYPDGGSVQDNAPPYESYKEYGAYIQDDWKIRHNLTFNLGIRWDTETSPVDRQNHLAAGLCLTCVNPISSQVAGGVLPNGATMVNPILGTAQFASSNFPAYENTIGTFQPKFGFSYALRKDLVVRGGWGLGTAMGIELGGASPWQQSTGYNAQSNSDNWTPTESFNQGNPYPNSYTKPEGSSLGGLTFVGDQLSLDQRDRKIPVVQSYSFGFQGELPLHIIADLEYVGMRTIDIRTSRQLDGLSTADVAKGATVADYLDQQVPNPFYGKLPATVGLGQNPTVSAKTLMVPYPQFNGSLYIYTHADGYQNYNSMIAKAEKRMSNGGSLSKGLSFLGSFTWAKLMTDDGNPPLGFVGSHAGSVQDWRDMRYEHSVSPQDVKYQFTWQASYDLPVGKDRAVNLNGVSNAILGDWTANGIFYLSSGVPINSPYVGNNMFLNQRADMTCDPSKGAPRTAAVWFTPDCFAVPASQYIPGNAPPYLDHLRTMGANNLDLTLSKSFKLGEKRDLRFDISSYNVANRPQFSAPNVPSNYSGWTTGPNGNEFGQITTTSNSPRQFQFGARFTF